MNTKPGRPKSTQEDREQKAFNDLIKIMKIIKIKMKVVYT